MSPFISKLAESYLGFQNSPKRTRFLSDLEVAEEFTTTRDHISSLLDGTKYYHGTGAFHYENLGSSKYDGTSLYKTTDSLAKLVTNGLEIRHDFYNETMETGVDSSISLTERRLYARLYAQSFLPEGHELDYEYGSKPFWWNVFLTRMTILEIERTGMRELIRSRAKRMKEPGYAEKAAERSRKAHQWVSSFRNDDKYALRPWASVVLGKSTIPENFPIIVGVKEGVFSPLPQKFPGVAAYETRSGVGIRPEHFTHLQVPYAYVGFVREKVNLMGLQAPVVAIEFAELIDSEQSLDRLVQFHPVH